MSSISEGEVGVDDAVVEGGVLWNGDGAGGWSWSVK